VLIDITTKVTPKMIVDAQGNENKSLVGHIGTHFDVMNKEFPLSYIEREAIVFDVKAIRAREISISDIAMDKVVCDMFVAFYTGFIEDVGYGNSIYFKEHPQLSNELMTGLVKKAFQSLELILRVFAEVESIRQKIRNWQIQEFSSLKIYAIWQPYWTAKRVKHL